MRLKAICCGMYMRALAAATVRSRNTIDPEFIKIDPSDQPEILTAKIQSIIDNASLLNYNAVLVLLPCEKWLKALNGLVINKVPVVFPRKLSCNQPVCSQSLNMDNSNNCARDDWVFAWEVGHLQSSDGIQEAVKVDNSKSVVKCDEPVNLFNISSLLLWEREAEIEAEWFGWDFEKLTTDFNVLQRLVNGYWSYEEFIVLMPGSQFTQDTNNQQCSKVND